jgi:hypothetical protein
MNEYVLVEFIAERHSDSAILFGKLDALGEDFILLKDEIEREGDEDGLFQEWVRVSGKINAAYASVIKLQDPFLADRMRISYIPDDLKNKYRR